MSLRACGECRRHVRDELVCPFCGAEVRSSPHRPLDVGRVSRAAAFAGGLLGGCYSDNPPPQGPPPPPPPHVEKQQQQQQQQDFAKPPDGSATSAATGTIQGRITDTGGAPVQGYRITLQTYRGNAEVRQIAETDANGHYAFTDLPPGKYIVSWPAASNPRRPPPNFDVTLGEHETKKLDGVITRYTPTQLPTPYGAPPARRRVV